MGIVKTKDYDILIKKQLFKTMSQELNTFPHKRWHILADENVYRLYEETILNAFKGIDTTLTIIPEGETSKSFHMLEKTINNLMNHHVKRQEGLIALGGGVVGDLTGLVAALLYRGIDYIQIPTTLLAMVDSSLGGKTAINLTQGKNLVGAFHMPKKVFIDPSFLDTLPKKEYLSGLSETYKAALIKDASLYKELNANTIITEEMITKAIKVKLWYVEQDPLDNNIRHILNFGHTFGHAIEKQFSAQNITHGEAIAHGMIYALSLGVKHQITPKTLLKDVKETFIRKGLIQERTIQKEDLLKYLKHDKKSHKEGIRFIFLEDYQKPIIHSLRWEELT